MVTYSQAQIPSRGIPLLVTQCECNVNQGCTCIRDSRRFSDLIYEAKLIAESRLDAYLVA